ncbi:hypothetical protein ABZ807_03265 [Micromonospora sp. NPDC047548]|uniref:hypothetical protein n=1 Tax=Micromonospora sp. NPDC047548 TaxID=3155624 RepID=UPI0033C11FC5
MFGFLAVNLVLAALLHRWVETPMMRRLAPRRRPGPAPAAGPSTLDPDVAPHRRRDRPPTRRPADR